jgi:hypothetical protein
MSQTLFVKLFGHPHLALDTNYLEKDDNKICPDVGKLLHVFISGENNRTIVNTLATTFFLAGSLAIILQRFYFWGTS